MPRLRTSANPVQNIKNNGVGESASVFTRFQMALNAHRAGRLEQAEEEYRQILALYDGHADAFHMLAIVRHQFGDMVEAESLMLQALAIREDVIFLANLGKLLQESKRWDEAEAAFRRALHIKPDFAQVHYLLGVLLLQRNRLADAEGCYRRALKLSPVHPFAHHDMGKILHQTGRWHEAEASFGHALMGLANFAQAHHSLGLLLAQGNRLAEAEAAYRRAIEIQPDYLAAHDALVKLLLMQRRFVDASICYDACFVLCRRINNIAVPAYPQWHGQPVAGKSILILQVNGCVDYVQFIRYAGLLKEQGASRIILAVDTALQQLLRESMGIAEIEVVGTADFPAADYWTVPVCLPHLCGATADNIPADLPYLQPPASRLQQWAKCLPSGKRRVGLVLNDMLCPQDGVPSSLAIIAALAPLWNRMDVNFVCLQNAPDKDEPLLLSLEKLPIFIGNDIADMADIAAIISQLDLVICADIATAHLAGALGKPCWVLVPAYGASWCWLPENEHASWYPDVVRLIRQAKIGEWGDVAQKMLVMLHEWVEKSAV